MTEYIVFNFQCYDVLSSHQSANYYQFD